MAPSEWLEVVRREYLEDFVRGGGAAVKFVVPVGTDSMLELHNGLRALAEETGYQFASVDATLVRIHQIDKLFNAVARQIDWDVLTRAFLSRLFTAQGLKLPDAGDVSVASIAELNSYPEPILRGEVRTWIWKQIAFDYAMSREFRMAMIWLCLSVLDPTDDPTLEAAIKAWLHGELRLISGVKKAQIFQKIARHNARHILGSLTHWLHLIGRAGLVLILDVARYAETVRPSERGPGLHYTTAATLDAYEVLRQFIDATDEFAYCFIAVTAGLEFLHDDRRGLQGYRALYLRVADDVRDRHRQNPLSSLVRVEAQ